MISCSYGKRGARTIGTPRRGGGRPVALSPWLPVACIPPASKAVIWAPFCCSWFPRFNFQLHPRLQLSDPNTALCCGGVHNHQSNQQPRKQLPSSAIRINHVWRVQFGQQQGVCFLYGEVHLGWRCCCAIEIMCLGQSWAPGKHCGQTPLTLGRLADLQTGVEVTAHSFPLTLVGSAQPCHPPHRGCPGKSGSVPAKSTVS